MSKNKKNTKNTRKFIISVNNNIQDINDAKNFYINGLGKEGLKVELTNIEIKWIYDESFAVLTFTVTF